MPHSSDSDSNTRPGKQSLQKHKRLARLRGILNGLGIGSKDGNKDCQSRVAECGALSSHPPNIPRTRSQEPTFYIECGSSGGSVWSGPISYTSHMREDGVIVTDTRTTVLGSRDFFDSWRLDFSSPSDTREEQWVVDGFDYGRSPRCVDEADRQSICHQHPVTSPEKELSLLDASNLRDGARYLDWFEEEPGDGVELPYVRIRAVSAVDLTGKSRWN